MIFYCLMYMSFAECLWTLSHVISFYFIHRISCLCLYKRIDYITILLFSELINASVNLCEKCSNEIIMFLSLLA